MLNSYKYLTFYVARICDPYALLNLNIKISKISIEEFRKNIINNTCLGISIYLQPSSLASAKYFCLWLAMLNITHGTHLL